MIKAVIFDMDGIMIDSEPLHSQSWERLLKEYKIKPIFNSQGLVHEVGIVSDDSYLTIMKKHNLKENLETVREKRRKYFIDLIKEKGVVMPGLLKLIKMLKSKKVKTAVSSSRNLKQVNFVLNQIKVRNLFKVIIGRTPGLDPKPAPDMFLLTAKKLNVKPSECLVLEDSKTGVEAGKAAGMKVIAVPTKHTKHHDFSEADLVVDSLKDIKWSTILSI